MRNLKSISRISLATLLFLCAFAFAASNARAADDPPNDDDQKYEDEYDQTARVARISELRGSVSVRRAGGDAWEDATLNLPLAEGDQIVTGRDSRVEIQLDARNFLRLDSSSALVVNTLRDAGVAFSLSDGVMSVRLAKFDRSREYFEVDAPNSTTFAAERTGLYRLDVFHEHGDDRAARLRFTARDGGSARIYTSDSGFTLRSGRAAELAASNNDDNADWQFYAASDFDSWDRWNEERDRYLANYFREENRERYGDIWGAEELDRYGSWSYTDDYGYVWTPYSSAISPYADWTPYRYGAWRWFPPYGWTWIAYEPWGWAPYHYGRWVYYRNAWCWTPYGYFYHQPIWRPALVAFVYLPSTYGERIAWYPLGYYRPDPFARNYYNNITIINNTRIVNNNLRVINDPNAIKNRRHVLRAEEIARLENDPAYMRAVSTVPAQNFGAGGVRPQPVPGELARRALTGDPVRQRLPIKPNPANGDGVVAAHGARDANGALVAKMLTIRNPAPIRPTGAAPRTPGVALDETLRRTRIDRTTAPRANSSSTVVSSDRVRRLEGDANISPRIGDGARRPVREANRTNDPNGSPNSPARERRTDETVRPARPSNPTLRINKPAPQDSPAPVREEDSFRRRTPPQTNNPPAEAAPRREREYRPAVRPAERPNNAPELRRESPAPVRQSPPPSKSESPRQENPKSEPSRTERAPATQPARPSHR